MIQNQFIILKLKQDIQIMIKATVTFNNKTKLVNSIVSKLIDSAVDTGSKIMERNIKVRTPVITGHLRRSITSKKTGFAKAEVFTNPVSSVTRKKVKQSKDITYAKYVEYGTKHMAPRAMFRKGVADSEEQIKQVFKKAGQDLYNGNIGVK